MVVPLDADRSSEPCTILGRERPGNTSSMADLAKQGWDAEWGWVAVVGEQVSRWGLYSWMQFNSAVRVHGFWTTGSYKILAYCSSPSPENAIMIWPTIDKNLLNSVCCIVLLFCNLSLIPGPVLSPNLWRYSTWDSSTGYPPALEGHYDSV